MVEDYERKMVDTGGTNMGQEGYGAAIKETEYHMDSDLSTEAIIEHAEPATQEEACMVQMEAIFDEKFVKMIMKKPPQ